MASLTDLQNKINALYGYTPTTQQLIQNPDLINIALDAIAGKVMDLPTIATALNTLLGTSYNGSALLTRPDLLRLGLAAIISDNQATVADGSITAIKLASDAVTTAKIANANVTPVKLSQPFTASTAVNTTSGTAIDFTSIPSWVKRITISFNGVSTNGTSNYLVRIGSGSVDATGYASAGQRIGASSTADGTSTVGFLINIANAASLISGLIILTHLGANVWAASGVFADSPGGTTFITCGNKTLSGALDRVRLTTAIGTDTFDAGSINIFYE